MRGRSIPLTALLVLVAAAFLSGGCKCKLVPWALAVDPSLTGNSDADGMLEPFETVVVEPSWKQNITGHCKYVNGKIQCTGTGDFTCNGTIAETGTPASFTGPITGDYVVQDGQAAYGTFGDRRDEARRVRGLRIGSGGPARASLGRYIHREPERNLFEIEILDDPRRRQFLGRAALAPFL